MDNSAGAGGGITRLSSRYDGIICDLDGVVYRGHEPVPYAVESLQRAAAAGIRIVYATNNASRPPADVATQLRGLGLDVADDSVVTSSQAGASLLASRLASGAPVLAVGGEGVRLAIAESGLLPVDAAEAARRAAGASTHDGSPSPGRVQAVLQGYGADVGWHDLAEAAYAVTDGAWWVATNDDGTLPTARGMAPGNGALVGAVRRAVDVDPVVVGKPHTPLYDLSRATLGTSTERTLAIGDRLDTDIAGAVAAGVDSLMVLTGVHGLRDVALAPPEQRPRYLAFDLRALDEPHREVMPGAALDAALAEAGLTGPRQGPPAKGYGPVLPVGPGADPSLPPSATLQAVALWCWHRLDHGDTQWIHDVEWDRLVDAMMR